jgi:hypothetical protein
MLYLAKPSSGRKTSLILERVSVLKGIAYWEVRCDFLTAALRGHRWIASMRCYPSPMRYRGTTLNLRLKVPGWIRRQVFSTPTGRDGQVLLSTRRKNCARLWLTAWC